MNKVFWIIICLFLINSCKEKDNPTTKATTEVFSPLENSIYYYTDQVPIKALITHPVEVHSYTVDIKVMPKDSSVFFIYKHEHTQKLNLDLLWHNLVDFDSDLKLELITYDHANQVDTTIVNFKTKLQK